MALLPILPALIVGHSLAAPTSSALVELESAGMSHDVVSVCFRMTRPPREGLQQAAAEAARVLAMQHLAVDRGDRSVGGSESAAAGRLTVRIDEAVRFAPSRLYVEQTSLAVFPHAARVCAKVYVQ